MNFKFKGRIIERFGSQAAAAFTIGISETRLSRIIHGFSVPTEAEREKFRELLGADVESALQMKSARE